MLETNAKSKKCNLVEAGLYIFKAWKLYSRVLYSGHVFPKKLAREATPPPLPHAFDFGFDFEMEKRIKQQKAKRVLEDKHLKFMQSLALIISC